MAANRRDRRLNRRLSTCYDPTIDSAFTLFRKGESGTCRTNTTSNVQRPTSTFQVTHHQIQIIPHSEDPEPKQPDFPTYFSKWQPLFLLQQRNLGLSSSHPYPLSKLAKTPSSLPVQVAILGENTPNAAGPFWVTASSALEMQRIQTSEA
jgi:hypothetical protein